MTLDEFMRTAQHRGAILAMVAAGGATNTLALLLANHFARTPEAASAWTFAAFAAAVGLHVLVMRRCLRRINAAVETMLHDAKRRIVDRVLRTDLASLEDIGAPKIFDRLTEAMAVVSLASSSLGAVLQGLSILAFALAYIAWLSPGALLLVVVLTAGTLTMYRARVRVAQRLRREYDETRVRLLDLLIGLIRGAKELKLSRARGAAARADFARASAASRRTATRFANHVDDITLLLNCNLYLLLAAIVFVLPSYVPLADATLSMLLAVVMFVWGSMEVGLDGYPNYVQAEQAMAAIDELERRLGGAEPDITEQGGEDPWTEGPGAIELVGVEYVYSSASDEAAFRIGPIDLTLARGEIVFIVGGNGSGKTTLVKVLTGLYRPTRGTLRCGGVRVVSENALAYREAITPILADFHLFSRAYGLLDVAPAEVRPLLRQMQIAHKTDFESGGFTRRDLSTGQRKRLAMVLALLEDRPVMVFDEWAADQDPEFRRYFYEELLPGLRRRGKTVIAISHDDRYFYCADRVVTMDAGAVRSVRDLRQGSDVDETEPRRASP